MNIVNPTSLRREEIFIVPDVFSAGGFVCFISLRVLGP